MIEFEISKFHPEKMPLNSAVAFVGPRGSGKSHCMRDIIWYKRRIPSATVYCPTHDPNVSWDDHFPSTFIYQGYDSGAMNRVVKRQRKASKKRKRDPNYRMEPTLVLCDDCMFDKKKVINDPNMREILMNGRHLEIFLMISAQYLMDLSRDLRGQFSYVFLFQDNDLGNIERLWKNWAGMVPTFDAFYAIFKKFTQKRGCLVIDVQSRSDKIEDCIFWYKSETRDPYFKVGSRAYWIYHFANVKPDDDESDEEQNQQRPRKDMKNVQYRIKKIK